MKNPPHKFRSFFPAWHERTFILGILNCTPDSFSDGGQHGTLEPALARTRQLVQEGADGIDVGAESTRPGAQETPVAEQLRRLEALLPALVQELGSVARLSIDTRHREIANFALSAGFHMVNDVSGGTFDPEMLDLIAQKNCLYVLMHMRGVPETMMTLTDYGEHFWDTLKRELSQKIAEAAKRGVQSENMILDPGIGFAKTPAQSLEILRGLSQLKALGLPILIGPSRKSFLRHSLPERSRDSFTEEMLEFTTGAAVACGILQGADLVRIHNVKNHLPGIRLLDQIKSSENRD